MPVRDTIFETLKSELQTVIVANGYNFDLNVDRTVKSIDELGSSNLPAVFVIDNGADIPDQAETSSTAKHDLEIELLCYFRSEANLHTEFGKFMADMMKILYKPPSFGSIADNFRLLRIDTVLTAPPDKIAIFTVGLTYWFNKASP